MFRYFTKTRQYQYLDVFQVLVNSYNNSYHHSIKRSPARARRCFSKGYLPAWTVETFRVKVVRKTVPVTYIITDYNYNDVKGTFCEEELQRIGKPQDYKVEKILRKSRDGKKLSAVVGLWYRF
ncbi:integrase core domain-containing protein [Plakobranchus ocellatus]|uniref:Integrase core domain-containing protein n=1 Tax=Plakobranchus ocellatus TaxID=259542 RepID=A0AAV4BZ41_9GAST|nr:integrase core domain-containing protein [Plakobranchus ocellatus]